MRRRTFLAGAVTSAELGLAGCAGVLGRRASSPNTYLAKPADQQAKSKDLVYPAWGQQFPRATLPAVFHGGTQVTMPDAFAGRNFFATFFYSHCPSVCPVLVSDMRAVQTKALAAGDDTAFVATTFDPRQDTKARLQTFAHEKYVDLSASDWYFLRPPSPKRAKDVIQGEYGIKFAPSYTKDGVTYFSHAAVIFLVNDKGYVERTYRNSLEKKVPWQHLWTDLKRLREREG